MHKASDELKIDPRTVWAPSLHSNESVNDSAKSLPRMRSGVLPATGPRMGKRSVTTGRRA